MFRRLTSKDVLIITYLVGVVGIALPPSRPLMLALTPVHLLLTALLLLREAKPAPAGWWPWVMVLIVTGYLIEWVGVHLRLPFGNYAYLENLGPHLWQVPPVIGVNWLILVLATAGTVRHWPIAAWSKPFLAATLMVTLDVLIEPLAPRMGLWEFWGGVAPQQNYISWFFIGWGMQAVFQRVVPGYSNPIAGWVVCLMATFFALLQFLVP